MTFKEEHRDFQELVREHQLLRQHNLKFKEGDPQGEVLLFAEGALVLIVLERFLRMILGPEAGEKDTLPTLLQKATGERLGLLSLLNLAGPQREKAIKGISNVRNALLHGNYEQAAKHAGARDVRDYFKNHYATDVEALHQLADFLVGQIDPETGKRR
jgi:hypothetical protein